MAQISEQMERMHRARVMIKTQIIEEKVAIHTEKKICLMCRGEALRFTYICECGAIYCEKCAQALTDLENICWSCNAPIDPFTPIKPYEKEDGIKISLKKDVETLKE